MAATILTDHKVQSLSAKDKPYEVSDSLCQGLILRVEKSGNKYWWVYLWTPYDSGQRKRYRWKIGDAANYRLYRSRPAKTEDREASIRDVARALKVKAETADLRQMRDTAREKAQQDKFSTLETFIDGPYTDHNRGEGRKNVAATMRYLKASFKSLLGKRIDRLTHLDIQRWMRAARKKGLKPTTIHRRLGSLSGVLSHAIACGLIDSHPLQAAQREKMATRIDMPKLPPVKNLPARFLSDDEEKRLRDALKARDRKQKAARARYIEHCNARPNGKSAPAPITGAYFDYLTPLTLLALNTGIRRGALLGLKWSDISSGQILISPELDKVSKGYNVPLNTEAQSVLRLWKKQTGGDADTLVFTHHGKPIKSIKTAWGNLIKDAKVDGFRFHDLRHTFASKLVMNGVDLNTVRELLGHADISMTLRYARLAPSHLQAAVKVLDV